MLRTALRPRWIGLLALALALATAFAGLGEWQLSRARERGQAPRASPAVTPLASTLAPEAALTQADVGRLVSVQGEYEGSGQLQVTGHRVGPDRVGTWVLTPLVVRTATGESRLPVVRGWVRAGEPAPAPPSGPVQVTGALEPGETPVGLSGPPAGGTVAALSIPDLLNVWTPPVYGAYVVLTEERPVHSSGGTIPAAGGLQRVAVQPPDSGGGLALQNLSYAVQWWLFAGFAFLIWGRGVRDAWRRERDDRSAGHGGEGPEDGEAPAARDDEHVQPQPGAVR